MTVFSPIYGNYISQAAVIVATFALLGILNSVFYAVGADVLRKFIHSTKVIKRMNQTGGAVIAAAGVAALFTRRPSI